MKKLTQKEIAKAIGCSRQYLSSVINGKENTLTARLVFKEYEKYISSYKENNSQKESENCIYNKLYQLTLDENFMDVLETALLKCKRKDSKLLAAEMIRCKKIINEIENEKNNNELNT